MSLKIIPLEKEKNFQNSMFLFSKHFVINKKVSTDRVLSISASFQKLMSITGVSFAVVTHLLVWCGDIGFHSITFARTH